MGLARGAVHMAAVLAGYGKVLVDIEWVISLLFHTNRCVETILSPGKGSVTVGMKFLLLHCKCISGMHKNKVSETFILRKVCKYKQGLRLDIHFHFLYSNIFFIALSLLFF